MIMLNVGRWTRHQKANIKLNTNYWKWNSIAFIHAHGSPALERTPKHTSSLYECTFTMEICIVPQYCTFVNTAVASIANFHPRIHATCSCASISTISARNTINSIMLIDFISFNNTHVIILSNVCTHGARAYSALNTLNIKRLCTKICLSDGMDAVAQAKWQHLWHKYINEVIAFAHDFMRIGPWLKDLYTLLVFSHIVLPNTYS